MCCNKTPKKHALYYLKRQTQGLFLGLSSCKVGFIENARIKGLSGIFCGTAEAESYSKTSGLDLFFMRKNLSHFFKTQNTIVHQIIATQDIKHTKTAEYLYSSHINKRSLVPRVPGKGARFHTGWLTSKKESKNRISNIIQNFLWCTLKRYAQHDSR